MSQEKVDQYKSSKKNRKEEVAKQKKQAKLRKSMYAAIGIILICALALGIVFTVVNSVNASKQAQVESYQASEYVVPDVAGIQSTEADDDTEADSEEVDETAEETTAAE